MAYLSSLTRDLSQDCNYVKVQLVVNTTHTYLCVDWQHLGLGGQFS